MKTKQIWIAENEAIVEQLINQQIMEPEFTDRMIMRGFEPDEVSDMVAALMSEKDELDVRSSSK